MWMDWVKLRIDSEINIFFNVSLQADHFRRFVSLFLHIFQAYQNILLAMFVAIIIYDSLEKTL